MIHVDTSFLVDLLRERAQGKQGAATRFLETLADERLVTSMFAVCELQVGVAMARHPERERSQVATLLQGFPVIYPDDSFPETYGALFAQMSQAGRSAAPMDLLIATAAVIDKAALVTGNRRHFEHVPGLKVLAYG